MAIQSVGKACSNINFFAIKKYMQPIQAAIIITLVRNLPNTKQTLQFFCLFDLILYVPVNNFSVMSGRVSLGRTSTKQG